MTWSPFLTLATPGPTSTTMPAPSWPRIAGNRPSGSAPEEVVGMTDAGGFHLDKDFAGFRPVQLDVHDRQRLALFECNGGTCFHGGFLATGISHAPPQRHGLSRLRARAAPA